MHRSTSKARAMKVVIHEAIGGCPPVDVAHVKTEVRDRVMDIAT